MEDLATFRPAKRRKFIRQHGLRAEDEVDVPQVNSPAADLGHGHDASLEVSSVASILKLRRQQRSRAGGVQFSNLKHTAMEDSTSSTALVPAENPVDNLKGIADRFVGYSGQVVDVDKHMVAYIDSEMAKRRAAHPSTQPDTHESYTPTNGSAPPPAQPSSSTRQPASQGLLKEVEVTDSLPPSLNPPPSKPRKPRLDRFGRPLPPRKPRKGRPSEDIARDRLVEEIMTETGLDVYQKDTAERQSDDDEDADARLASRFQQEYLDALRSRQQRQQLQQGQKKAVPGAEPGQKGPKLGGSRQQRAAMREREEKEKGKGTGGGV